MAYLFLPKRIRDILNVGRRSLLNRDWNVLQKNGKCVIYRRWAAVSCTAPWRSGSSPTRLLARPPSESVGEWKQNTKITQWNKLHFFFQASSRRGGSGSLPAHQKHWAPSQNNQWPHAMIKVTERLLLSPAASPFPQQLKIDEKTLSLSLSLSEFFYPSNYTLRFSLPKNQWHHVPTCRAR